MKQIPFEQVSLADWERRVAAHVRQLFRAMQAEDAKAIEECSLRFKDLLVNLLPRYLEQDPRWPAKAYFLDHLQNGQPSRRRAELF